MDPAPSEDSNLYGYIPTFIYEGQSFRAHRPETSTPAPGGLYTGAGTRTPAPRSKCNWNCAVCVLNPVSYRGFAMYGTSMLWQAIGDSQAGIVVFQQAIGVSRFAKF